MRHCRRDAAVILHFVCLLVPASAARAEETTDLADTFCREMAAKAASAQQAHQPVVRGKAGWLFFTEELRSLGVGRFWGATAANVRRAANPKNADPLAAIVDFHQQLKKAGIRLILVPAPAKAALHPGMISALPALRSHEKPPRLDIHHREFYRLLSAKGVEVLDVVPTFLSGRVHDESFLCLAQDTHLSPTGRALTAQLLARKVARLPWFRQARTRTFETTKRRLEYTGDLWLMLKDPTYPKANTTRLSVRERTPRGLVPVRPWRDSPVVLLGDSNAEALADYLAAALGFPADLLSVLGSGASVARRYLAMRKDNLKGKHLVVWCFSVREFTKGYGWTKVPVIRPAMR
jgi:alginate O-acetyltransferase complex protein AlgJ